VDLAADVPGLPEKAHGLLEQTACEHQSIKGPKIRGHLGHCSPLLLES
jgi:hypothetical protein